MQYKSKDIAKASVIMAMSSREEEIELKEKYIKQGIKTAAVDIAQIMDKAVGFNVGGKIGIARCKEHLSVCIFLTIGMFRLDEVVIGLGHRAVPVEEE